MNPISSSIDQKKQKKKKKKKETLNTLFCGRCDLNMNMIKHVMPFVHYILLGPQLRHNQYSIRY